MSITFEANTDPVRAFRFRPEQWLWCMQCRRFFQGRHARPDPVGGMQG